MNPGELNCRLTLLEESKTPDGQGGYSTDYVPRITVWGKITTIAAKTLDQYE